MKRGGFRYLMRRHRTSVIDLGIIIVVLLVATYLCYEIDVFPSQGAITPRKNTIELDEFLLLGIILAAGLVVFSIRRYLEQKRQTHLRILAEQKVRELAFQDPLTGLPNRRQFDDALRAAVAAPPRTGGAHALLLLDLNGFKKINDVYGHGVGDAVLVAVAQRLRSVMRDGELVARIGGDEFAIVAMHLSGAEAATSIAGRILQVLENPVAAGPTKHQVGAGIGIALIPNDATTAAEALRLADVALYRAKAERRPAVRFFEESMDRHVRERDRLEVELRTALTSNSITPWFAPSVDLRTQRIVAFEASPRWVHATYGDIGPERFIPIAEETGLINILAEHVLREACAAAVRWPAEVALCVDMFPSQLRYGTTGSKVLEILASAGLAPSRLEIQITESALVQDLQGAQSTLGVLREVGVKVALGNFGTGYSSLYHLRNFKFDKIKIDRRFIDSLGENVDGTEIVAALVGLGHGLGLTIAAEGIDDVSQRASLLRAGCEQGQGRLFSGLLPADAATRLVQQREMQTA